MKHIEITENERELYWEVWEEQHQFLTSDMADEIENMFNTKNYHYEKNLFNTKKNNLEQPLKFLWHDFGKKQRWNVNQKIISN